MNAPNGVASSDGPTSGLDQVPESSSEGLLDTEKRLRSLLRANRAVVEQLELPVVLRTIVESALELVGARYGGLRVTSDEGGLDEFVRVGAAPDAPSRIGRQPQGLGVLSAIHDEGRPVRIADIEKDLRFMGFPDGHPRFHSFLGVPITVGGHHFGTLYCGEKLSGEFTLDDEELLTGLAFTAGIAINNARQLLETRQRERRADMSAEIAMSLVSNEPEVSLRLVADSVAILTRADLVCVVAETTDGTLIIDPARGPLAEGLEGLHIPADGTQIAAVLRAQVPFVSAALDILVGTPHARTTGPIMLLPLFRQGQSIGVLVVARAPGGAPFSESELETIAMFARHASLAIDGARFRAERRRIETLQDRTRIARELHDHVIQSIFAAGLDLQAILRKSSDVELNKRLDRPIDMLDTVISEIRTAVFALRPEQPGGNFSLRRKLVNLVTELGGLFPETPRLTFAGPLDLTIDPVLGNDVVAVVREHLGNLSREGRVTKVSIGVSVTVDQAIVEIAEDDSREDTATNSPLLESLNERANHWRGSLLLEQGKPSGTRLTWMATLPTPRRGGTHS